MFVAREDKTEEVCMLWALSVNLFVVPILRGIEEKLKSVIEFDPLSSNPPDISTSKMITVKINQLHSSIPPKSFSVQLTNTKFQQSDF